MAPAATDALLGPPDALGHRRLGHQERPGDLGGRQATDRPQGQRHLGGGRQRGVAAQEQQREGVVAHRFLVVVLVLILGPTWCSGLIQLLAPAASLGAAELVGEPP